MTTHMAQSLIRHVNNKAVTMSSLALENATRPQPFARRHIVPAGQDPFGDQIPVHRVLFKVGQGKEFLPGGDAIEGGHRSSVRWLSRITLGRGVNWAWCGTIRVGVWPRMYISRPKSVSLVVAPQRQPYESENCWHPVGQYGRISAKPTSTSKSLPWQLWPVPP